MPIGLLFIHKLPPDKDGYVNHRMPKIFYLWDNYGNDGTDGDINYRRMVGKVNYWTRFNWLAIRNRAYNFQHWIGVHTVITRIEGHGARWKEIGWGVWDAYDTKGRRYFEYIIGIPYWKRKDGTYRGLCASIGYKNFNIKVKDLPKYYEYSFSADIQLFRILRSR